ncbi:26S proteasome regulatory subunit 10B homolog A-like [Durio zibethinus]|uniref:26S proteasome regulatory subunit 10B homolog A-like n=1 Tax=Durio zibethinus TaxID=66656 RepID=A0A6P5Z934_DURZI|nr:26S proteasome regulatory subunit 10B homolog A-like [Durio zibethinus]
MGVHLVFHFILLLWLIQAAASQETDKSTCTEVCGNVTITSLFRINDGRYTNSWFRVTCNKTTDGQKPFISGINLELLGLFSPGSEIVVNNPVTYVNCGNKDNNSIARASTGNLTDTPFLFSVNTIRPKSLNLITSTETLLARAIVGNNDANFLKVVSSVIIDKYIGESARLIREMFGYARDHPLCIIFMGEIDAIGGCRFSEGTSANREIQRTLMELLNHLD